jgi:hypothetical protein
VNCLKVLSTEPTITVEAKYRDAITVPNHLHIMMATNADWAIDASLDARRFCVLNVNRSRVGDFPYFKTIYDELENGGYEAMLYDLIHLPLLGFNVREIPNTAGLEEQKKLSLGIPDQWLKETLTRGYVWESELGLEEIFGKWLESVTTELLFKSYEAFENKRRGRRHLSREEFGKFMVAKGFKLVRIPHEASFLGETRSELVTATDAHRSANVVAIKSIGRPVLHEASGSIQSD